MVRVFQLVVGHVWLVAILATSVPAAVVEPAPDPTTTTAELAIAHDLLERAQRLIREPNAGGFTVDVAELLAAVGDADAAEAVFSRIQLTNKFGDVALRRLATGYARGGDLVRARQTIERIKDNEAQKALAWLHVGQALAERGQEEAAAEAFGEAVRSPGGQQLYVEGTFLAEVAEAQHLLGQVAKASATFEKAVDRAATQSDSSLRHIGMSEIAARQAKLGLLDAALETARRITDAQDRQSAWADAIEALTESGRLDTAEEFSRRVSEKISRPWTVGRSSLALAEAYVQAGRVQEARGALKRTEAAWREMEPEARIGVATRIGRTYGAMGDEEVAASWLDGAAALAEGTTIVAEGPFAVLREVEKVPGAVARQQQLRAVAVTQAKLGFTESARETFERAEVAARGEQPGMWQKTAFWVIAKSQAQAGLPDDAMETMEALPEPDRDWLVYVEIAVAKARAGHLDEALRIAESLASARIAKTRIAEALAEVGDRENALRIGLEGDAPERVLRAVAHDYSLDGDIEPVMQAVEGTPLPSRRVALLLGVVDGLLRHKTQSR